MQGSAACSLKRAGGGVLQTARRARGFLGARQVSQWAIVVPLVNGNGPSCRLHGHRCSELIMQRIATEVTTGVRDATVSNDFSPSMSAAHVVRMITARSSAAFVHSQNCSETHLNHTVATFYRQKKDRTTVSLLPIAVVHRGGRRVVVAPISPSLKRSLSTTSNCCHEHCDPRRFGDENAKSC